MRSGSLLWLVAALVLAMSAGRAALEGPAAYHGCADCHLLHGGGGGDTSANQSSHLRGATALDTCLRCHAGVAGIPDVVGSDINGLTDRAAGAFAAPGSASPSGHALGTPAGAPGAHATGVVTCIDCHDPHANAEPRGLRHLAALPGSVRFGLLVDPQATGLQRYEASRVAYAADPSDNLRAVSDLCLDCHRMSPDARQGGMGGHTQHPTAGVGADLEAAISHGDFRGSTDSRHWVEGAGSGFDVPRLRFLASPAQSYREARVVSPDNRVFCLTCHKAHGSGEAGGLAWQRDRHGAYGPAGCNQCHRKGA